MAPSANLHFRNRIARELGTAGGSIDGIVPLCLKGRKFFFIRADGSQAAILARKQEWATKFDLVKLLPATPDNIGHIPADEVALFSRCDPAISKRGFARFRRSGRLPDCLGYRSASGGARARPRFRQEKKGGSEHRTRENSTGTGSSPTLLSGRLGAARIQGSWSDSDAGYDCFNPIQPKGLRKRR
jgi:hypothetical protein